MWIRRFVCVFGVLSLDCVCLGVFVSASGEVNRVLVDAMFGLRP